MGHSYTCTLLHFIFGTKRRRSSIEESFRARLHDYLGGVARREIGRSLIVGGTTDHVHILASLRTDVSAADAMRKLKALSSRWVHQSFENARDFAWQTGYGVFSVSRSNADAVTAYIARQAEHHKHRTFEEEFLEFLKRHGIDYDPRFVWD
jgi:REP element-mobilizing transposase RayT